jgi:hypothetical protein
MLIELLREKGYHVRETATGRYMRGLVPLLGGQYTLDILRDVHLVRLFSNAKIRKGHAYTLKQLAQMALPEEAISRFMVQMAQLTERGAFIRGYRLQCPTCDLDSWYALDDIAEMVTCQGCRIPFQLPLELDFAFRPNRLLMEATKSGALTVLLTLFHWLQDSPITVWLSGLEVSKNGQTTDIDLLAQREDGLYMAECKDNFNTNALEQLQEQLQSGKAIAEAINATYVFATLYDEHLPPALQNFCEDKGISIIQRTTLL